MKKIAQALLIFLCLAVLAAPALASGTAESGLSADEALKLLKDGNARYLDGKATPSPPGRGPPGPDRRPGTAPLRHGALLLRFPGAGGSDL